MMLSWEQDNIITSPSPQKEIIITNIKTSAAVHKNVHFYNGHHNSIVGVPAELWQWYLAPNPILLVLFITFLHQALQYSAMQVLWCCIYIWMSYKQLIALLCFLRMARHTNYPCNRSITQDKRCWQCYLMLIKIIWCIIVMKNLFNLTPHLFSKHLSHCTLPIASKLLLLGTLGNKETYNEMQTNKI